MRKEQRAKGGHLRYFIFCIRSLSNVALLDEIHTFLSDIQDQVCESQARDTNCVGDRNIVL